jgi:hypothetical protein
MVHFAHRFFVFVVAAVCLTAVIRPAAAEGQGKLFDVKVPEGFKQESGEEAGIVRWSKGQAAIYVVVGDLIAESGQKLYEELVAAAEKNKGVERVTKLETPDGKAFSYVEKAPESLGRLRSARLFLVGDRKTLYLDLSAPARDFDSLLPEFDAMVRSVRIVSGE